MTEPRRLVENGTEFERSVLASARLDGASDDGLKRVLVAIGAGAVTISASAATAGAGVAAGGGAGAAAGGMTVVAGVGASTFVKWIGVAVAVVCVGTAVTAASLPRHRSAHADLRVTALQAALAQPPAPANLPTGLTNAPAAAIAAPSLAPGPTEPSLRVTAAGAGAMADVAPAHSARWAPSARSEPPLVPSIASLSPSLLEAEVSTLDRVRAALGEHDAAKALKELDAYDRAFPNSVLGEEATVLRVDALVEKGDRTAAEALSRRFLSTNPASPHALHLWQLLGAHNL